MLITPIYAAVLALMVVVLAVFVIRGRYRTQAALGDANDITLTRRIRAHANLVEYAPLFILLLAFAELQSTSIYTLHALGCVFVLGRMSHAYSLLRGERYVDGRLQAFPIWRTVGMACTFTPITILSILLLIHSLSQF